MITLDTSAVFALLNRLDPGHERMSQTLSAAARPYIVPVAILAEIAYIVESRLGDRNSVHLEH